MIAQRLARRGRQAFKKTGAYQFLNPPGYPGVRLTPKRLLNLYVTRYHQARGDIKLLSYPHMLTLEATNVCNLKCPYCFTGAGEVGRERSMMPMDLYQKILDELGDYLFYLELCSWGEPLLNKHIYEMFSIASRKGISTLISTNFSIAFDRVRAEALVSSGLARLGVSIDGARQESYEKYRVKGNLETILANVRLVNEAKKRLGSATPRVIWEFHVFEWNRDEIDMARSMAEELEMVFAVSKGWVEGPDWDPEAHFSFSPEPFPAGVAPKRCGYPWDHAMINNDGGVAACCGAFYKEDDYGSIVGRSFREVWNNQNFQNARRLFRSRSGSENLICHDCPVTVVWEDYKLHRAAGHSEASFVPRITTNNETFNYFFSRRPAKPAIPKAPDVIDLQPVDAKPSRSAPQKGGRRRKTKLPSAKA